MIVGDDGVIIVDPGQAPRSRRRVRAEFDKITAKPVKAIIYTHGHGDHTNGAPPFFQPGKGIEVWARSNFGSEQARLAQKGLGGGMRPANSQGFDLLPEQKIGIGIAIPPARRPQGNMMQDGLRRPADAAAAVRAESRFRLRTPLRKNARSWKSPASSSSWSPPRAKPPISCTSGSPTNESFSPATIFINPGRTSIRCAARRGARCGIDRQRRQDGAREPPARCRRSHDADAR